MGSLSSSSTLSLRSRGGWMTMIDRTTPPFWARTPTPSCQAAPSSAAFHGPAVAARITCASTPSWPEIPARSPVDEPPFVVWKRASCLNRTTPLPGSLPYGSR